MCLFHFNEVFASKIKVDLCTLPWTQKFARPRCGHVRTGSLLSFINMLELPGGNVGEKDSCDHSDLTAQWSWEMIKMWPV